MTPAHHDTQGAGFQAHSWVNRYNRPTRRKLRTVVACGLIGAVIVGVAGVVLVAGAAG
jgi:hypothetical protein